MIYLAHINSDGKREQSILEHLKRTAEKSSKFASAFSAADMGYLCGILHDIGKYSDSFQRRIRGSMEQVDHSTAGAKVAFDEFRNVPAAFCIAGHHSGLPDCGSKKFATVDDSTFFGKMSRKIGTDIENYNVYKSEVEVSAAQMPVNLLSDTQSQFFFTRMLYSCLVDADFLDTETFMKNGLVERCGGSTLEQLNLKLSQYISPWLEPQTELNHKRCEILNALIEAGDRDKGLFSLTVPTGGGKTVSSMAFALRHALNRNLRRIIYVIPYTSIIEQTQQVFEEIFGRANVVAHYASIDYSTDEYGTITDTRYLSTENWDAPIILTTSVQFFQSLYANRSSRCRKLHNIVNSVIIFDEAQMLPVPYLKPCVSAIAQLVKNYGCSAVLCTATQPALNKLFDDQLPNFSVSELCPEVSDMYTVFQRVRYEKIGKLSDQELTCRLNIESQVLCIVNNRTQAQSLYTMLSETGRYHLSTTMYPAHRRLVLAEIRQRLKDGKPCRVVSTSLVEAGVDVDFPTVYRALAGLDSMIQAGGRCNREGKRGMTESVVCLFETEQKPPQIIAQNIAAAQWVMRSFENISSPEAVKAYFNFLYYTLKDEKELDKKQILNEIGRGTMPFANVAAKFRMIEGSEYTVYIPMGEGAKIVDRLKKFGPSRSLTRKLGQYSVGVYPQHFTMLVQLGAAEKVSENAAVLCDLSLYKKQTGLSFHVNEGLEYII